MVTTTTRPIVRILREGNPDRFSGKTTAHDMRSWIEHQLAVASKNNNENDRQLFMITLKAYNSYHPRQEAEIKVDSWHGHSSFEIIKGLDKLTIVKFQKKVKGDEPTEVRTEVSKDELNALIYALRRSKEEYTETKELALDYCLVMGLNDMFAYGEFWRNFFSNRKLHNKFTLMLGALDKLGLVEYKGGKTKLLNKDLSVQLLLL